MADIGDMQKSFRVPRPARLPNSAGCSALLRLEERQIFGQSRLAQLVHGDEF